MDPWPRGQNETVAGQGHSGLRNPNFRCFFEHTVADVRHALIGKWPEWRNWRKPTGVQCQGREMAGRFGPNGRMGFWRGRSDPRCKLPYKGERVWRESIPANPTKIKGHKDSASGIAFSARQGNCS